MKIKNEKEHINAQIIVEIGTIGRDWTEEKIIGSILINNPNYIILAILRLWAWIFLQLIDRILQVLKVQELDLI